MMPVENGMSFKHQSAPVGQRLHTSHHLSRAENFRIENYIKYALAGKFMNIMSNHAVMLHAGHGFMHGIQEQHLALRISDANTVTKDIQDLSQIISQHSNFSNIRHHIST